MFRKSITSTFDDPNGGQAEFERHRAEAAKIIGDNPKLISSNTSSVPIYGDDNATVVTHKHKLSTVWES